MRVRNCPNPKCHRKIEKPILLTNLSTLPAEQYYACPHCFIKLKIKALRMVLIGLLLTVLGSITLAWVGQLTWHDITVWGKDIARIFFGSRTGENISLGVGMKVIHYLLIGLAFLLSGLITVFWGRRSKAIELPPSATVREREEEPLKCPYNFGYLKKLEQNAPIPKECLKCSRISECSSLTVGKVFPTIAPTNETGYR